MFRAKILSRKMFIGQTPKKAYRGILAIFDQFLKDFYKFNLFGSMVGLTKVLSQKKIYLDQLNLNS